MSRIWFRLVESSNGNPYKGVSSVTSVTLPPNTIVDDFRKAVKAEVSDILTGVSSIQLIVYKNMEAFKKRNAVEDKEEPLRPGRAINDFGNSDDEPLIVVVSVLVPEIESNIANLLPPKAHLMTTYLKTAHLINSANDLRMQQLLALIGKIYEDYRHNDSEDIPFIVLEASSGTGKSQSAFNLMQLGHAIGYTLCVPLTETLQSIYQGFFGRVEAYLECVEFDLKKPNLNTSVKGLKLSDGSFFTFGFIVAVLTENYDDFKPLTWREAMAKLAPHDIKSRNPVMFLDEFPVHNSRSRVDDLIKQELRFMRNSARALNLVVIISSTNSSGTNLTLNNESSRGELKLWCYLVPRLPAFVLPDENIPPWLKTIVSRSRPWFAQLALNYYSSNPAVMNLPDFLDALCFELFQEVSVLKKARDNAFFKYGQLALLLSVTHIETTKDHMAIEKHFAMLPQKEPFPLYIGGEGLTTDDRKKWENNVIFPSPNEDFLLHLVFLGGKHYRPVEETIPNAIDSLGPLQKFSKIYANTNQISNDGQEAEATLIAAAVIASRRNGLAGIGALSFLRHLWSELNGLKVSSLNSTPTEIADILNSVKIPFLAAPNISWFRNGNDVLKRQLEEGGCCLGEIVRTKNKERIDGKILKFHASDVAIEVTLESKDRKDNFGTPALQAALKRKPLNSKIHVVRVNRIISTDFYSTQRVESKIKNYDDFVKSSKRTISRLAKCYVCYMKQNGDLAPLPGILNKCRCTAKGQIERNHAGCKFTSVVIIMQVDPAGANVVVEDNDEGENQDEDEDEDEDGNDNSDEANTEMMIDSE